MKTSQKKFSRNSEEQIQGSKGPVNIDSCRRRNIQDDFLA